MKSVAPSLVQVISRQSEIVGEEDALLEQMVTDLLPSIVTEHDAHFRLARDPFLRVPLALQRRIIRRVLGRLDRRGKMPRFTTVEAIVRQILMKAARSRFSIRAVEVFRDGGPFALASHVCNLSRVICRHRNISVPESPTRWLGLPLVNDSVRW